MGNVKMFCITLNPEHLEKIKKMNYLPVGLGDQFFSKSWFKDNTGLNISNKNKFYGEYTFHYWIWKNYLNSLNEGWIGFCQYRKFWGEKKIDIDNLSFEKLNEFSLKKIPDKFLDYESILGEPFYVNQFKFSKFLKKGFKKFISSPSLLFDKNKRSIKFHFDLFHGNGNLDKAIQLLEDNDREDFRQFVEKNVSFNPHNMFICKSKKILEDYYKSIFPWLQRCEEEFGFDNLRGYGLQRIYGFLAERYMSFWFKKYTKFGVLPLYFKDITYL